MAGTATNAGSVQILKRKYKDGLPKANYQKFPAIASLARDETWVGDDLQLSIQIENPQGIGASIGQAQGNMQQGNYQRFLATRVEYFGVARIKGQALKTAVKKGGGAVVDLWTNEVEGIQQSVLKAHEIFFFGTGNGVRGTISSGNTTVTLTLTTPEDVANFDLGMNVGAVSDTTLSPTVRAGTQVITAIDRVGGTITGASAWNVAITGLVNGDSLLVAGDASIAGTPVVPFGARQLLIGGTSPGILYGLQRNVDPTRLSAQVVDLTGLPMESALIDEESLLQIQGQGSDKICWANPRDTRQLKKSLGAKLTYPRMDVKSQIAGLSFKGFELQTDTGIVPLMVSPFTPKANNFMIDQSTDKMYSAGELVGLLDFDGLDLIRVSTDDAYEVRVGGYMNRAIDNPVRSIRAINWGS